MKHMKIILALVLFAALTSGGCGGHSDIVQSENEKMIQAMSLEEKVGQMFIIRPEHLCRLVSSDYIHNHRTSWDTVLTDEMRGTLEEYPAGGFILFARNLGDTKEQVQKFTADLKAASEIEPFVLEKVKEKKTCMTETFEEYIDSGMYEYMPFHYDEGIDRVAQRVGKENLIVRVYEKQQFVGGSLFSDFLRTIC